MSARNDERRPGQGGETSSNVQGDISKSATALPLHSNRLAERAAVGAALMSDELADLVTSNLTEADLVSDVRAADVLATIRALRAAGRHADHVTVHGELLSAGKVTARQQPDAAVYLIELAEACPIPLAAKSYVADVAEASLRRRVVEAGIRLTQLADGSAKAISDTAINELSNVYMAVVRLNNLRGGGIVSLSSAGAQ